MKTCDKLPPQRPLLRAGPRGFTLLELLIAAAITVVLAVTIAGVINNVSTVWNRSSGRLSAEAQARYALDQLTLDLQGALFRDDANTWLAVNVPADTSHTRGLWLTTGTANALKPNNASGSLQAIATGRFGDVTASGPRFGQTGMWLRFFTTKRGTNENSGSNALATISAPIAVGYQIVRRAGSTSTRSTDIRYFLHRAEARPGATTAGTGTLDAGYDITSTAYAPKSNIVRQPDDPAAVSFPTLNSVLAENVIDFGVKLYVRDSSSVDGLRAVYPTSNSSTAVYVPKTPASVTGATDAYPEVVDVAVRILTDEGARLLAGFEANPQRVTVPANRTPAQYWWDLALANSRLFTRRIVLRAQGI
jgi:prepilin-type N-terminal cleavage/methylation domain-containing protein